MHREPASLGLGMTCPREPLSDHVAQEREWSHLCQAFHISSHSIPGTARQVQLTSPFCRNEAQGLKSLGPGDTVVVRLGFEPRAVGGQSW